MKTDVNWRSYTGDNPDVSGFTNPPDPQNYDDILKFGNCTNVLVHDICVDAGRENNVDAVRGSDYTFSYLNFTDGSGVATMTLKGAISGINISNCRFGRSKGLCEIELGQFDKYWYPGRPPTSNVCVNMCSSMDGKPIRIWLWDSERPSVFMTDAKITKIPRLAWFPYFCLRWVWIRIFP